MKATTRQEGKDEIFECHRARVFSVAYRILGSVADAEDVVQDAWLRWRNTDTSGR